MDIFGVGAPEIVVLLIVAFLVLGPQQMARTGRRIGKMVRGIRETGSEFTRSLLEEEEEEKSGGERPKE